MSLDILERNLSALQVRQPEIALLINSAEFPDGLVPAMGRDGTPTFLIPGEGGPAWMGGSSMPRTSAEEMFGHVDPRGGSVTLPAMLTGMEAIVLAERLAPRFAVFVVDVPQAFKMALALRDYQAHFHAGRIVLLAADDIPLRAREFFTRHPGHAVPAHMFKIPQLSAGLLSNLARTLEEAGAAAMAAQNDLISARVRTLHATRPPTFATAPRIVILTSDDSQTTLELARRLHRAISTHSAHCEVCLPVNPEQSHVAARVAAVERSRTELVFYLNGVTQEERSLFGPQLPLIDWLTHGVLSRPRTGDWPLDLVAAESRSDAERTCAAGWPREQVVLMEPAADNLPDSPWPDGQEVNGKSALAIMMDLPDDRPEAAGVTLPSHISLWQAMQQLLLRDVDRYDSDSVGNVFRAAQKSSGTMLTDPALAASFEGFLRSHIAPATVARSLAQALVKNGFQPDLWGRHWPPLGRGHDLRRGPIPSGDGLHRLLERPAWVVIPWFWHAGVQLAVEAMARGCVVTMRGTRDMFVAEYPGLAELADSIHWFRAAGELATSLRGLISRHESAAESARMIARRIRAEHTVAVRVRRLIDMVRGSQEQKALKGNA